MSLSDFMIRPIAVAANCDTARDLSREKRVTRFRVTSDYSFGDYMYIKQRCVK